ncbi:MAG TPA: acetate uptake transporter [Microlunatus sp.]|nr:acetate uptake transporter [Microlunatus sp.]
MSDLSTPAMTVAPAIRAESLGIAHHPVHTATAGPEAGPAAAAVGDPLALGLAGFGVAVGVVGVTNAGLLSAAVTPVAFGTVIASGFLLQLIAGLLAFRRGETFVGVVFCSWSAFFLGIALLAVVFAPQIALAGGSPGDAFGIYLIAWAVVSTYHWIAAMVTIKVNVLIFGLGTCALYVLGVAAFMGNSTLNSIGGWLQIVTGALMLYLSAATLINEMHGRRVLPVA